MTDGTTPVMPPPVPKKPEDPVAAIIPYKNVMALLAYYFGVFGLIPCLGLPLAVAAVVFGPLGLRQAKRHPEAKGKAHSWVGLGLGLASVLYHAAFVIMMIVAG